MTVLLDYLCSYFNCVPSELNDRLKESKNWIKEFGYPKNRFKSKYSLFQNIHFCGFTEEAANNMCPYSEDTLEEYYKKKYDVVLKYPHLVCILEEIDENVERYYPLELVIVEAI